MDTIADMLTIIRNGYLSRKKVVVLRRSRLNESIARKLVELEYIDSVQVEEVNNRKNLKVNLLYKNSKPVLEGIKRVSRPSVRVYTPASKIPKVLGGLGEVVISTPNGVLTGSEAKKKRIGGEVLFEVW